LYLYRNKTPCTVKKKEKRRMKSSQNHVLFSAESVLGCLVMMIFVTTFSSSVQGFSLYPAVISTAATKASPFSGSSSLHMAKKNKNNSKAKGFGKTEAPPITPMADVASAIDKSSSSAASSSTDMFTSVQGGSSATPQIDESVPVEDRTKSILRDQYGLRTAEEMEEARRRQETVAEQRKKLDEWKKQADAGQDFDLMQILPAPVLVGIDYFLKAGTALCTLLFVVAGGFITVEAYSKTTGTPLPDDLDRFIVETIEPNFTPGLGVLLGFSVSLGAFATAQLSSASSTYREDR
jgi:hypothetical protein